MRTPLARIEGAAPSADLVVRQILGLLLPRLGALPAFRDRSPREGSRYVLDDRFGGTPQRFDADLYPA